jgi:voltage-gated potassium channel
MLHAPSTARRAGLTIAAATIAVAIVAAFAMRLADEHDFSSTGSGLWWAVQTITTVGYGDKVPTTTSGQLIATVVMVTGIAFMSVVTAAISAAFVESARRRRGRNTDDIVLERLERIEKTLARLEEQRHAAAGG